MGCQVGGGKAASRCCSASSYKSAPESVCIRHAETYEDAEAPDASVPTTRMHSKQMPALVCKKALCIWAYVKIMA